MVLINDVLEKIILDRKRKATGKFFFDRDKEWEAGKAASYLRKYQKELNITQTNFHSLRSAFITQMLLTGCIPAILQEIVGHERLLTTEIYVKKVRTRSNLRNAIKNLEPKAKSNLTVLPTKKTGS